MRRPTRHAQEEHQSDGGKRSAAGKARPTGNTSSITFAPAASCTVRCATSPPSWSPREGPGAVVNLLRGLMEGATWAARWALGESDDGIPRLVESAVGNAPRCRTKPDPDGPAPTPAAIDDTLKVFERWLLLKDHTPVLAVLGAIATNYLPGDPVWLALIAPPSSAKTEMLNATARLPQVVQAARVTPAGL